MKFHRILFALTFALPLALVPSGTARAFAEPLVAVLGAPDAAFREKFKKLMEKDQKSDMEKLVKSESSHASAWINRANEILFARPDDPEMGPFLEQLTLAWNAAQKTAYPEKQKAYFDGLTGNNKDDRVDLRRRFDKVIGEFESNAEKKDAYLYTQMIEEMEILGFAFEQIGDQYFASEMWLVFAACHDEELRGPGADTKRTIASLERAIAARAKLELTDDKKEAAEKRKAVLSAKSGAKPSADAPGEGPTPTANPINVPLTFDMLASPDAFQRPNYHADDFFVLWRNVGLKGNDSSATLEGLTDGPNFYRLGAADVRIDADGDGKADGPNDIKVMLTGSVLPVKLSLGTGAAARPWAFFAVTAGQQELYQGIQVNMSPTDNQLVLYGLSAASLTGTLDGQAIRIIDDSMDGVYGSVPQTYGFVGLTKGFYQPDVDSFVVGNSKRARPWSEIAEVNGKWWKFDMGVTGEKISATPIKTDTGLLKLEFKGPNAPNCLIMRGTDKLKDSFFDITEAGSKGVQVPVGRYTLYYGEIRKGKKRQMEKCVIVPPKSAINYDVTKGGTTVVTLGAPFGFDFTYRYEENKLTVVGQSVVVTGSIGERYERPWQSVAHPEAGWRKKGAKKAAHTSKMPPAMGYDSIEKHGWESAWFPLDHEMEVKGADEVEVQLIDKKHDLFGKVESDWK
ncbi:MAG: hypothetical protein JNL28_02580 [Planctomycetes bacterium]|nr:hypothetical protein [Planctomycetota bacterium]